MLFLLGDHRFGICDGGPSRRGVTQPLLRSAVVAEKELATGGLGSRRVVVKVHVLTAVGKKKTVVVVVAAAVAARVGGRYMLASSCSGVPFLRGVVGVQCRGALA